MLQSPNFYFWEPKGLPKIFLRQQPWEVQSKCGKHHVMRKWSLWWPYRSHILMDETSGCIALINLNTKFWYLRVLRTPSSKSWRFFLLFRDPLPINLKFETLSLRSKDALCQETVHPFHVFCAVMNTLVQLTLCPFVERNKEPIFSTLFTQLSD